MKKLQILPVIIDRTPVYKSYLREVERYPVLSARDERQLMLRYLQDSDQSARNALVNAHLRFVVSVASQHTCAHLSLLDLIQEGNMGLIRAVETFSLSYHTRLLTYALEWIRLYITVAIAENEHMVSQPDYVRTLWCPVRTFVEQFLQRECRMPEPEEVADGLHVPLQVAANALSSMGADVSMDSPMGKQERNEEEVPLTLAESICGEESLQAERTLWLESLRGDVRRTMRQVLDEREQTVLCRLYGIGCQRVPLDDLSTQMGLSPQSVKRIWRSSILALRACIAAPTLRSYV